MPPLWKWMRAGKVSVKCPPSMWDVASKNPLSKIHHRSQHWNCVSLISYKSNILITAGITERDWYLTPFSRRAHSSHGKFPWPNPEFLFSSWRWRAIFKSLTACFGTFATRWRLFKVEKVLRKCSRKVASRSPFLLLPLPNKEADVQMSSKNWATTWTRVKKVHSYGFS